MSSKPWQIILRKETNKFSMSTIALKLWQLIKKKNHIEALVLVVHSPADKLQLQPSINLQGLNYAGFEAGIIGKINSKLELGSRFFWTVTTEKVDLIHKWIYMQQNSSFLLLLQVCNWLWGALGLRNVEQTFHSDALKCCTWQNLSRNPGNTPLKMPFEDQLSMWCRLILPHHSWCSCGDL